METLKWYFTMETSLSNVDPTSIHVPISLPDNISLATESISDMIKCGCSGSPSKDEVVHQKM